MEEEEEEEVYKKMKRDGKFRRNYVILTEGIFSVCV